MTKFLLDSGDPDEYNDLSKLMQKSNSELWGSTTNPSLIAKKLASKKVTQQEAFSLQKEIVMEILDIVPGAVSAEVYADEQTSSEEMISQGKEITTWHERIYVKLPTTIEGFKARTALRKEKVAINNTLVFSLQQIFAICLHEEIMTSMYGSSNSQWPTFISPFVGRLDDQGEDGMTLVEHGMKVKSLVKTPLWMLEASVRRPEHIKRGVAAGAEILTAPMKAYQEWFALTKNEQESLNAQSYAKDLKPLDPWQPSEKLLNIKTINEFMASIESAELDISHPLTDKGIIKFAQDWKAIVA